jgi:hypothetical protein
MGFNLRQHWKICGVLCLLFVNAPSVRVSIYTVIEGAAHSSDSSCNWSFFAFTLACTAMPNTTAIRLAEEKQNNWTIPLTLRASLNRSEIRSWHILC